MDRKMTVLVFSVRLLVVLAQTISAQWTQMAYHLTLYRILRKKIYAPARSRKINLLVSRQANWRTLNPSAKSQPGAACGSLQKGSPVAARAISGS